MRARIEEHKCIVCGRIVWPDQDFCDKCVPQLQNDSCQSTINDMLDKNKSACEGCKYTEEGHCWVQNIKEDRGCDLYRPGNFLHFMKYLDASLSNSDSPNVIHGELP